MYDLVIFVSVIFNVFYTDGYVRMGCGVSKDTSPSQTNTDGVTNQDQSKLSQAPAQTQYTENKPSENQHTDAKDNNKDNEHISYSNDHQDKAKSENNGKNNDTLGSATENNIPAVGGAKNESGTDGVMNNGSKVSPSEEPSNEEQRSAQQPVGYNSQTADNADADSQKVVDQTNVGDINDEIHNESVIELKDQESDLENKSEEVEESKPDLKMEAQEKFNTAIKFACSLVKPDCIMEYANGDVRCLQLHRALPHTVSLTQLLQKLPNIQVFTLIKH